MKVFFDKREELVSGIWQYYFRTERPVPFEPGQYVDLYLKNIDDPRGTSRTFSLTSLPNDDVISFVLKHFTLQSPYKTALQQMQLGDEAHITDPMGDLVLPKDINIPLVYVAGGIGIASYASMLKDLLARREERRIFFYYQLQTGRERIFRDLTDSYPLEFKTLIIEPNRLTGKEIIDTSPPESLIYLSGSQKFVERLRQELEQLSVARSQIVFDYYEGYAEL